jgi:hypothetical protein
LVESHTDGVLAFLPGAIDGVDHQANNKVANNEEDGYEKAWLLPSQYFVLLFPYLC